jgi:hypothetical protein
MNWRLVGFAFTTLSGVYLLWNGYKEFQTRRYDSWLRSSLFKRAQKVTSRGRSVIPIAIWHMLAGILLAATSIYAAIQTDVHFLSFLFPWFFISGIVELLVMIAAVTILKLQFQEIDNETDPD